MGGVSPKDSMGSSVGACPPGYWRRNYCQKKRNPGRKGGSALLLSDNSSRPVRRKEDVGVLGEGVSRGVKIRLKEELLTIEKEAITFKEAVFFGGQPVPGDGQRTSKNLSSLKKELEHGGPEN